MKVLNIQYPQFTQIKFDKSKKNSTQNSIETNLPQTTISSSYKDYNISFSGRTPENFYEQDFNRENMPYTMKNYLNYDYEQRQHIPPEQMMREVFKYIDTAKNFDEVKRLYPNEDLFKNLHNNTQNHKTNILAEIKIAKELSDAPLLKDGSDDFGMYLLKKIYMEGKTLKEISKDFLEKDINDEYKDFITKPINYETTSAYGIKFPKQEFWHSFIATRDEYKKFFVELPKNTIDPNRIEANKTADSKDKSTEVSARKAYKPEKRKYTTPHYKKEQLKRDLKDSDLTAEDIEKKIKKRFTKDDPEASFIVKYLQPIMVVAADRIHLSEELKTFYEADKNNPNKNNDYALKRFWKENQYLKQDYANSIIDTIELFEDNYGAGGMIPINNEFQPITKNSENSKPIDFVTENFISLVNSVKNIESERKERYAQHDELQKQWEEHFITKYGEIQENKPTTTNTQTLTPTFSEELLENTAKQFNANTYKLKGKNGENIIITANLDEVLRDQLKSETKYFPSKYKALYLKFMLENPEISDRYKLSIAANQVRNMLDDDRIMSVEEIENEKIRYYKDFCIQNIEKEMASTYAIADAINKNLNQKAPTTIYKHFTLEFNRLLEETENYKELSKVISSSNKDIDTLYEQYSKPLTNSEIHKITLSIMDEISKYNPDENNSIATQDTKAFILMLKDITNDVKIMKDPVKGILDYTLPGYPHSRSLLDKHTDKAHKTAKFEQLMNFILKDMLFIKSSNHSVFLSMLNEETVNKYKHLLTPETRAEMEKEINFATPEQKQLFKYTNDQLKMLSKQK